MAAQTKSRHAETFECESFCFCHSANLLFRRGPGVAACSTHFIHGLQTLLCISSTLQHSAPTPLCFCQSHLCLSLRNVSHDFTNKLPLLYSLTPHKHKEAAFILCICSQPDAGSLACIIHFISIKRTFDVLHFVCFQYRQCIKYTLIYSEVVVYVSRSGG